MHRMTRCHSIVFSRKKGSQKEVWNFIAESWHRFRVKTFEDVKDFLRDRDFILDLGCGSGRNFVAGKKYIGIDFSGKMLEYAKKHAEKNGIDAMLIKADISALPLKHGRFDTVLMIAVLHSMKNRSLALSEMKKVMAKNGKALITVWNKIQPRFLVSKKELHIPWKSGSIVHRYYYLFAKRELRKLLSAYFIVEKIYGGKEKALKLFPKNIIAIVRKE